MANAHHRDYSQGKQDFRVLQMKPPFLPPAAQGTGLVQPDKIQTGLGYALSVWDLYLSRDGRQLGAMLRRAARFVTKGYCCHSNVTTMLEALDWDSLETHRAKSRLSLLGNILHGRVTIYSDSYLNWSYTITRTVNSQTGEV